MSNSVENKVVGLKFDNDDFMKKISPTLKGLDELKKRLDVNDSTNALNGLSEAGKRFNLDGVGAAVDNVQGKFSVLSGAAAVALGNIVTMAIQAGSRFVKAFAISPILDGLNEFETNTNSIQTILANTAEKGTTLSDVTQTLDELNQYSDKTIYNFGQMAKNIGTFTANGVGLKDAASEIKGISNLAALAGSNAEQASGAYYQLSQAIAAGTIHAQDWQSVVTAGFAGPLSKQIFEAAKALGDLPNVPVDQTFEQWQEAGGNFKDAMAEGTFSAKTLELALKAMSGEMTKAELVAAGFSDSNADKVLRTAEIAEKSATEVKSFTQLMSTLKEAVGTGWADTFKLIIGDFDEAKGLFTDLSNLFGGVINTLSGNRNADLSFWKIMGGRDGLVQSLRNVLWSLFSVVVTIKTAFRDVFPYRVGENLVAITNAVLKFTTAMIPSIETLGKLRRIFAGVFSVLHIGFTAIKIVFSAFSELFKVLGLFKGTGGGLLSFLALVADGATKLDHAFTNATGVVEWLFTWIHKLGEVLNNIDFSGPAEKIGGVFLDLKDRLLSLDFGVLFSRMLDGFGTLKEKVIDFFKGLGNESPGSLVEGLVNGLKDFSTKAFNAIKDFGIGLLDKIKEVLGIHSPSTEMFDIGKNLILGLINGIIAIIPKAFSALGTMMSAIIDGLKKVDWSLVVETIKTALLGGLLFSFIQFVRSITGISKSISGTFGKIGEMFEGITGVLKGMQQSVQAEAIKKIAIALAILTASVLVLSTIDGDKLAKAMGALSVGLGGLVLSLKELTKETEGPGGARQFVAMASGLILIGIGVFGLALAIKVLSGIDLEGLGKGLFGVAALLGLMLFATKMLTREKEDGKEYQDIIKTAFAIAIFAHSVKSLAKAVRIFAEMDAGKMFQGLVGLAAVLGILSITLNTMPEDMEGRIKGMLKLSVALYIMAKVVENLGTMDAVALVQGLSAITLVLGALSIMINSLKDTKPREAAAGLAIMALALVGLAIAVRLMGNMDIGELAKGLGAVIALLVALTIAANSMQASLPGAAAMVVMAGALLVLAGVLKIMADIGFGSVILGILGVVIAIVAIAGVSVLLSEAVPFILAMGVALLSVAAAAALFGVAVLAVGAGIYLLIAGFKLLADFGVDSLERLVIALPKMAEAVGKAIIALVKTLIESIPSISEGLATAIESFLDLFNEMLPKIAELIGKIITTVLTLLAENQSAIIEAGFQLLLGLLAGVRDHIGEITLLVSDIITNFLNALSEKSDKIATAALELLATFLKAIADNIGKVYNAGGDLIVAILEGVAGQVLKIIEAGGNIIIALIFGIEQKAEDIVAAGVSAILKFLDAMASNAVDFVNKAAAILTAFLNGLAEAIRTHSKEINDAAKNLVGAIFDGLINAFGLSEFVDKLKKAVTDLANKLPDWMKSVLGIQSPSKVMYGIGEFAIAGLVNSFNEDTSADQGAKAFGQSFVDKLKESLKEASNSLPYLEDFNPSITPILDLDQVKKDVGKLGNLLKIPEIDTTVSFGQAASLSLATKDQDAFATQSSEPIPTTIIKETKFEQNNYSPKALSADDIYRGTKSQIALAREELIGESD